MVNWKRALGIFGMGITSLNGGCGSEGITLAGDYPAPSAERMVMIEKKISKAYEKKQCVVEDTESYEDAIGSGPISFNDGVQEFIYHKIRLTEKDSDAYGLPLKKLDDKVKVSISPPDSINCSNKAMACREKDGQINMPDYLNPIEFLSTFSHEYGHNLYPGCYEFPSVANETYDPIKAYQLSKVIGSLGIENAFRSPPALSNDESIPAMDRLTPFSVMYAKGSLFALVNLLEKDGSIERALSYVTHTKTKPVKIMLDYHLSELATDNTIETYFTLWNKILDSNGFLVNLTNDTGHLSYTEAVELIDYLRIVNFTKYMNYLPDKDKADDELELMLEDFVSQESFTNPFFRANVTSTLSSRFERELSEEKKMDNPDLAKLNNISDRIISLNLAYPCRVADPYLCPSNVRTASLGHVEAYNTFVISSFALNDSIKMNLSVSKVIEFIEKFYPGAKFADSNFNALAKDTWLNNYVAKLAHLAATHVIDNDPKIAENFLKAATTVSCLYSGSGYNYNECSTSQYKARIMLEKFKTEEKK